MNSTTYTFTGRTIDQESELSPGTGHWNNPIHWDPDSGTPGAADTAILDVGKTIIVNGQESVLFFEHGNGQVSGAGELSILSDWKTEPGSGLIDSVNINALANATMNGGVTLDGLAVVKLSGTTTVNKSDDDGDAVVNVNGFSKLHNTGSLDFSDNSSIISNTEDGNLLNDGVIESSGGKLLVSRLVFTNNGNVLAQGGEIEFSGNTVQNGSVFIKSDHDLIFTAGTHIWNSGSKAGGAFLLRDIVIDGATWITNDGFSGQGILLRSGNIEVDGNIHVFNLRVAGRIHGDGTVAVASEWPTLFNGAILEESVNLHVEEGQLLFVPGATVTINDEAYISNEASLYSRYFEIPTEGVRNIVVNGDSTAHPAAIQNYSVFSHGSIANNISDPIAGNFTINTSFFSDGQVWVEGGSLILRGQSTLKGEAGVFEGAELILEGDPVVLSDIDVGRPTIKAGTTVFDGAVVIVSMDLMGGTLKSSKTELGEVANLNLFGSNEWSSGQIRGATSGESTITLEDAAEMKITGGAFLSMLDNLRFINNGNFIFEATVQVQLGSGVSFTNHGTIDFQSNGTLGKSGAGGELVNDGTILKSAGTGTSRINVRGINHGQIIVESGTLELPSDFVNEGIVCLAGGDIRWSGGFEIPVGGELKGKGTVLGAVINRGSIRAKEKEGPVKTNGDLEQEEGSWLYGDIESVLPIAKFEIPLDDLQNPSLRTVVDVEPMIDVSGLASLAGNLAVTYNDQGQAVEGDFIPVLVANTVEGNFDLVVGPTTNNPNFFWGEGMREVEGRTQVGIEYKAVANFEELMAAIIPAEERLDNGGANWDPDEDGVPYLFEFAMGLDNEVFNDFPVSSTQGEDGEGNRTFEIRFPFLKESSDFAYHVEKGDLINPWEMVDPASVEVLPGEGETDEVVITILLGDGSSGSEFYRLVIETL